MLNTQIIHSKGQYINGEWCKGKGTTLESINPADGQLIWQGNNSTKEEISAAYQSARKALTQWSRAGFEHRAEIAQEFSRQVEKKREHLAQLISLETGKPFWESLTEVSSVIAKINISIQAYKERTWPKSNETAEATASLRFKPHGVVVVLGAFNFPAHLSNGHIVPALLAGNTVLYKPSEQSPAVAECIMDCWDASGLPKGVIQCLQGDVNSGKELLSQNIQGVYFTGSYSTGLKIHQTFSNKPEVILALEMGGNNPLVIDTVDDLDAAVYHSLLSTLITAGQRCTCARRLIIPNSAMGDTFLQRFIQACQRIKIGSFHEKPEPFIGPVISHLQALKHLHAQKQLIELGGESLLSMALMKEYTGFLTPGVIDMTKVNNPLDEEIFAPFVQIYRYTAFDEAIALANNTRYGLSAGLLGNNKAHYEKFYQEINAGLINWNRPTTGAASNLPFGGVGCSGNHRPSAYYAADYCAFPVASMEQSNLSTPSQLLPGIVLE